MRVIKRFFSRLPLYMVYAVIAAMFWSWVFDLAADAPAGKKVVLFADVPEIADTALAVELEKSLPEGLRMVQVHPFSYAMLNDGGINGSDLFVIRESGIETYLVDQSPITEYADAFAGQELYYVDGVPYAVKVYDAASGTGAAASLVTYVNPAVADEDCWLFFCASSRHIASITGKGDDAALSIALALLNIQ